MPRGYRCILVALVGIALAGASPPNQPNKNKQTANEKTETGAATYKPDPNRNAESCYKNPDHEAADLCAQWSAADAAKETANLAYWGNWISGAAAGLSFFSILLVLAALKQGREANRIAENTAKGELRAYLGIESHQIEQSINAKLGKVKIQIKNYGGSPAIRAQTKIRVGVAPYIKGSIDDPPAWERVPERQPLDVVPQGHVYREVKLPESTLQYYEEIMAGLYAIYIKVEWDFLDIFGRRHSQQTLFHARGKRYAGGDLNVVCQTAETTIEREQQPKA
jgi:hypothetical protein